MGENKIRLTDFIVVWIKVHLNGTNIYYNNIIIFIIVSFILVDNV